MGLLDDIKSKITEILGLFPKDEEADEGETPEEDRAIASADIRDALYAKIAEMDEYVFVHDLYFEAGEWFAVYSTGGKLYQMPIMIVGTDVSFGTPSEVEAKFAPVESRSSFSISRAADGKLRWFAVACSAVLNRVGEIDSTALFDSFVAHIVEKGEYPELRFYHLPVRFGVADWIARDGWLLLASGSLDEEQPYVRAFADAVTNGRGKWGISVGYQATSEPKRMQVADGVSVPVFEAGILREMSILLESDAAALLTSISETEVYRMNKSAKEAVLTMFGEGRAEEAEAFIADVDGRNRSIEDVGMVRRDGEAATETPTQDPVETPEPEQREIVLDDAAVAAIAESERVREALAAQAKSLFLTLQADFSNLEQEFAALSERMAGLEKGEEERKREFQADMPARGEIHATYRPREDKKQTTATPDGKPTPEELNALAEKTLADIEKKAARATRAASA